MDQGRRNSTGIKHNGKIDFQIEKFLQQKVSIEDFRKFTIDSLLASANEYARLYDAQEKERKEKEDQVKSENF